MVDESDEVAGPRGDAELNRYTQVIVDEGRRRGIEVTIIDAATGELELRDGARTVRTIESLSELTSAIAFRRCDDKLATRQVLTAAGLAVPEGQLAASPEDDAAFLAEHREIVVKPRRGEQGWGISVGVTDALGLTEAIAAARAVASDVILERCVPGDDLRVVVIGGAVVAASVRRPPVVVGDGSSTIASLVRELSRQRSLATDGASNIPLDEITERVVRASGYSLDDTLPAGEQLAVRRTANVHTGGTMDDVTSELHPSLAEVAVAAASAIGIPVVGMDLIVASPSEPEYVIIEANEQPGLANHEPQPTVERFVDLLFPG